MDNKKENNSTIRYSIGKAINEKEYVAITKYAENVSLDEMIDIYMALRVKEWVGGRDGRDEVSRLTKEEFKQEFPTKEDALKEMCSVTTKHVYHASNMNSGVSAYVLQDVSHELCDQVLMLAIAKNPELKERVLDYYGPAEGDEYMKWAVARNPDVKEWMFSSYKRNAVENLCNNPNFYKETISWVESLRNKTLEQLVDDAKKQIVDELTTKIKLSPDQNESVKWIQKEIEQVKKLKAKDYVYHAEEKGKEDGSSAKATTKTVKVPRTKGSGEEQKSYVNVPVKKSAEPKAKVAETKSQTLQ